MAFLIPMILWMFTCGGLLIWSLGKRSRILVGGVALIAVSLVPSIYGRWITPSESHDSPLMIVYYLPTLIAAFLSLIMVVAGFVIKLREALHKRRGA